jgi:aminoglycoside/choline kinase family phosphotransferase
MRTSLNQQTLRREQLIEWINRATPLRCENLQMVSGDASFRRYFRFIENGQSYIAVDAPPKSEDSRKFLSVAEAYQQHGIPVPIIHAIDHDLGFYCLQDFGDKLFADALEPENCHLRYRDALSHLPAIQRCTNTALGTLPKFDDTLITIEFELFTHWLLEVHLDLQLSEAERTMIQQTMDYLRVAFFAQPQVGVHRDYHSRNLMLLADNKMGIIDFQDAVIGPVTYDAASLLRDCYQTWPSALVYIWLKEWHAEYYPQHSWPEFRRWFDLTGMQRHIKASGIFARLCHRDGKEGYLQDIPRTLQYLCDVGSQYKQCQQFAEFVQNKVKPAVEQSTR